MRELIPDRGQDRADGGALAELYNAVRLDRPVYHSGEWGMATLEVVMAINESAKTRKDVSLTHQVPMPDEYDNEYRVAFEEGEPTEVSAAARR